MEDTRHTLANPFDEFLTSAARDVTIHERNVDTTSRVRKRSTETLPPGKKSKPKAKPNWIFSEPHHCDKCPFSTRYKCDFRRHKVRHVTAKFPCEDCNMPFNTEGHLKGHRRSVHGLETDKSPKPIIRCSLCPYTSFHCSDMRRHRLRHDECDVKCAICNWPFSSDSQRDLHVRRKHADDNDGIDILNIANAWQQFNKSKKSATHRLDQKTQSQRIETSTNFTRKSGYEDKPILAVGNLAAGTGKSGNMDQKRKKKRINTSSYDVLSVADEISHLKKFKSITTVEKTRLQPTENIDSMKCVFCESTATSFLNLRDHLNTQHTDDCFDFKRKKGETQKHLRKGNNVYSILINEHLDGESVIFGANNNTSSADDSLLGDDVTGSNLVTDDSLLAYDMAGSNLVTDDSLFTDDMTGSIVTDDSLLADGNHETEDESVFADVSVLEKDVTTADDILYTAIVNKDSVGVHTGDVESQTENGAHAVLSLTNKTMPNDNISTSALKGDSKDVNTFSGVSQNQFGCMLCEFRTNNINSLQNHAINVKHVETPSDSGIKADEHVNCRQTRDVCVQVTPTENRCTQTDLTCWCSETKIDNAKATDDMFEISDVGSGNEENLTGRVSKNYFIQHRRFYERHHWKNARTRGGSEYECMICERGRVLPGVYEARKHFRERHEKLRAKICSTCSFCSGPFP